MKKFLLPVILLALLPAGCGEGARDYLVGSTTVSPATGRGYEWKVSVYVYDPLVGRLDAELLAGEERIPSRGVFKVPVNASVADPPTAVFRFLVPRETIPGAKIILRSNHGSATLDLD